MSAGLTTSERNRFDIRERAKKIDEIGGRLSQFFADCADENTNVFFTKTEQLTTHFSIAVQKDDNEEAKLIVDILGNGNIKVSELDTTKNKTRELHHFEIRTNNDLDRIFTHAVFEMALDEVTTEALNKYGIDIKQGIQNAQNETPPEPKIKPKAPVRQPPREGKGLKI